MKIFFISLRVGFIMTWGLLAWGGGGEDIGVWGGSARGAETATSLSRKRAVSLPPLFQMKDETDQDALPLHDPLVYSPRMKQNDDSDYTYSDETDANDLDTSLSDDNESGLSSEITPRPSALKSPINRVQFFLPLHELPFGGGDSYRPPALRRGPPEESPRAKKKVTFVNLKSQLYDSDSSEDDSVDIEPVLNPDALHTATGGSFSPQSPKVPHRSTSLKLKLKQVTRAAFYPSSSQSRGHGRETLSPLSKSALLKLLLDESNGASNGALINWAQTRQIPDSEMDRLRGDKHLIVHMLVRNFDLEGLEFLVDAWSNECLLKALKARDATYNEDSVFHTLIRAWGRISKCNSGPQFIEAQQMVIQMLEILQGRGALFKADRFFLLKQTNDLGETPMHLFAHYLWADGLDIALSCMPSEIWQWCEGITDDIDVSHFKVIEDTYQHKRGLFKTQNTYKYLGHLSELFMLKAGKKQQTPLHLASIGTPSPQQTAFMQVVYGKLLDMDYSLRELVLSIDDVDGATCEHYAQENGFQWRFW